MITPVLIDARNYVEFKDQIIREIAEKKDVGIDIETDNKNAHAGIQEYGINDATDLRRLIITGLSIYIDGSDVAYYFNLNHADADNRLTWPQVKVILDAKHPETLWLAHNAPYEMTAMKAVYDFDFDNIVCTMQLAVSAYNSDEYSQNNLMAVGLGGIKELIPSIVRAFANFTDRNNMTPEQAEIFNQVLGKQSRATHSYNGLVNTINYGYGLKKAVKSFFNYTMTSYEEVVGKKKSMSFLTGEEVVAYGADDAYWCVRLFHHIIDMMLRTNPKALQTYFTQELPMVRVYADVTLGGVRIDTKAVKSRQQLERSNYATKVRELQQLIKAQLPFDTEPHAQLITDDSKYGGLYIRYRADLAAWATSAYNGPDDNRVILGVAGAVSKSLAVEEKKPAGKLNLSYYMTQRIIMYDLLRQKVIKYKGKVQSDGDMRGKMLERLEGDQKRIVQLLNELTSVEQTMKLYLNPYLQLLDPETGRLYPRLNSILATRRMAMQDPNPTQLAKRGESVYVRGFYLADADDEVLISLDWSSFELVIIGELSGDPGFFKAFGQLPFDDLHTEASVNCLAVMIPELTLPLFKNLGNMTKEEINDINPKILIKPNGEIMEPGNAKKFWRTEVGKGANFNYWYSGALSTVGDTLGWTSDQMWEATEKYRQTFPVAEQWRVDTINFLRENGYVELPDHHRRVRFEATQEWATLMTGQWKGIQDRMGLPNNALMNFANIFVRAIQSRAGNQGVNALVQGTNATCAKRTIPRIIHNCEDAGVKARFVMPIHDEVVFSVRRKDVVAFIKIAKEVMKNHPDIFKKLKLDCTASVGRTFQPWHKTNAPTGQIELDEIQFDFSKFKKGEALDDDGIEAVVDEVLFGGKLV